MTPLVDPVTVPGRGGKPCRWGARLEHILDRHLSPRAQWLIVSVTVMVTAVIRLARIQTPSLDRAAWKEIDFIAVSVNFHEGGYNLLKPEVDWPAQEPRFTGMEFPLVPWLTAWLYEVDGVTPLAVRLIPFLCWLALVPVIFLIARRELGPVVALGAAAGSAAFPLLNPFGTTLQSEPAAVMSGACAVYFALRWADERTRGTLALATGALSLTLLLKVEAAWIAVPMAVAVLRRHPLPSRVWAVAAGAGTLALLPPVAWYAWAYRLETSGVAAFTVFRGSNKFYFEALLVDPEWWSTMFGRLFAFSGGRVGVALGLIGAVAAALLGQRSWVLLSWAASGLIYTLLLAEGQEDAPYRQLYQVPIAAILVALGLAVALAAGWELLRRRSVPASLLIPALSIAPWLALRGGLPELAPDPLQLAAGLQVAEATSPGDRIVVAGAYDPRIDGYDLSPVVYHYSGRQGWTLGPGECSVEMVEALRAQGAALFVELPPGSSDSLETCSENVRQELRQRYATVVAAEYVIVDLTRTRTAQ